MERSFAAEVKQLALGEGEILRGEGILAITKALLQSGVSYVGGYPGAPVSHLLDVMADANAALLTPMGVYFDASANEASAAALLGASINYPMRGAVTWKSVVGTNVAADALSNLASAGVIGGALIVVGEDYGAGASVIQERTHAFALKSSLLLFDPRPELQNLARMVEEAFAMSEASNLPAVISLRIRTAHMRGTMVVPGQRAPGCRHERPPPDALLRLRAPQPSPVHLCPGGPEVRAPPARCAPVHRRAPAQRASSRGARGRRHHPAGRADAHHPPRAGPAGPRRPLRRRRIPLLVLNVIHPLVPDEVVDFIAGKERVLVIEEGMPAFIEQELKALAYDRGLGVRIHGKDLVAVQGEYVPEVVLGAWRASSAARRRAAGLR